MEDAPLEIAHLSPEGSPAGSQEEKVQEIMQVRLRVKEQRFIIVEENVPSDPM